MLYSTSQPSTFQRLPDELETLQETLTGTGLAWSLKAKLLWCFCCCQAPALALDIAEDSNHFQPGSLSLESKSGLSGMEVSKPYTRFFSFSFSF